FLAIVGMDGSQSRIPTSTTREAGATAHPNHGDSRRSCYRKKEYLGLLRKRHCGTRYRADSESLQPPAKVRQEARTKRDVAALSQGAINQIRVRQGFVVSRLQQGTLFALDNIACPESTMIAAMIVSSPVVFGTEVAQG